MTWYYTLISLFKIRSLNDPDYLARQVSNDGRRRRIKTINPRLTLVSNSFCFPGARNRNALPTAIRDEVKIGKFKKQVKEWILANVPQFLD